MILITLQSDFYFCLCLTLPNNNFTLYNVRWVHDHSDIFSIDNQKLVVLGDSAGVINLY